MKTRITHVRKNESGEIMEVMLEDGSVYDLDQAIDLSSQGLIANVNVSHSRTGRPYLRSNPNDTEFDNLDNLPSF
ncbi:MAG: DUF3892 domain-containing protein [Solirubrobacterales bacterium]